LPGFEALNSFLSKIIHQNYSKEEAPALVKTIALEYEGIDELLATINVRFKENDTSNYKKATLLAEKTVKLLQTEFTKNIDKLKLIKHLRNELKNNNFQLYKFVQKFKSGA